MPDRIHIYFSTDEHNIYPPGINDGTNSIAPGASEQGDKDFTTLVEAGQEIQFTRNSDDRIRILSIGITDRRTFTQFPSSDNDFVGVIGNFPGDTVEYDIQYYVEGVGLGSDPGDEPIIFSQDPRLRMNR